MTVFKLESPSKGNLVDARHRWCVPAALCPDCGSTRTAWGVLTLAYPHIELPETARAQKYKSAWPVSWEEYEKLRKPILEALGKGSPVPPGTNFGPLVGSITGPFPDFNWIWSWQCLVREGVLKRLNERLDTNIKAVPAKIRSQRKEKPDYFELVALPIALLSEASKSKLQPPLCSDCGHQFVSNGYFDYREPPVHPFRVKSKLNDLVQLKRQSIPENLPVFRIRDLPHFILCSEQFRAAVVELGLSRINFVPMQVVTE